MNKRTSLQHAVIQGILVFTSLLMILSTTGWGQSLMRGSAPKCMKIGTGTRVVEHSTFASERRQSLFLEQSFMGEKVGVVVPLQTAKPTTGENDPVKFEEAKRWIEQSINAYGGDARLSAITDLSFTSQSAGQDGKPVQFKVYFKGNDKFRSEVTGAGFFAMTIANGPSAWLKSDQTLIELTSAEVEPLEVTTLLQSQPYVLYDRLTKFWAEGERTVEGKRYRVIGVSGFLAKFYTRGEILLDPQTFLVQRFVYEQETEANEGKGVRKYELGYEVYKPFNGIQLPTRVTSVQAGVKSVTMFSDYKINSGIPESFFEKPPE